MADRDRLTSPNAHSLRPDAVTARAPGRSIQAAFSVSVLTHAFGFMVLALAVSHHTGDDKRSTVTSNTPAEIVWLPQPGPPHGGGGSGNRQPEPARRAKAPGRDTVTVPAVRGESPLTDTPRTDQKIQVLAVSTMADVHELPGIVTTVALASSDSQGPGTGDQGGRGSGPGSGPGIGPGLGPGQYGGTGGDAYQLGSGVIGPRLIKETKPAYTADAMRAKIQGLVLLEAIVLPDGSVGRVRIVRSLDTTFGLDEEAVAAVKRWRFMPGTLAGRAVPVLVNIELAFTLR
jgi:protein TonB